ncbi:hypothetical protein D3C75_1277930 [compost metagenome]
MMLVIEQKRPILPPPYREIVQPRIIIRRPPEGNRGYHFPVFLEQPEYNIIAFRLEFKQLRRRTLQIRPLVLKAEQ